MLPLIITNGQSGVEAIRQTGIKADFLSWDDVLHDGAVPLTPDLPSLSSIRAAELAGLGFLGPEEVTRRFVQRDQMFRSAEKRPEIIGWFEHDLYDQLQLWQVLHELTDFQGRVALICEAQYVTHHSVAQLDSLYTNRTLVSRTMFDDASRLWNAFRSNQPTDLLRLLNQTSLPFANEAINRWKYCFPSATNGLNRIEQEALVQLQQAGGHLPFGALFQQVNATEDPVWMGDASFIHVIDRLAGYHNPLIRLAPPGEARFPDVFLLEAGKKRLEDAPWEWDPATQYWVGGVKLDASDHWVFDAAANQFEHRRQA